MQLQGSQTSDYIYVRLIHYVASGHIKVHLGFVCATLYYSLLCNSVLLLSIA